MDRKQIINSLNQHSDNSSICLLLAKKLLEIDSKSSRAWYELGRSLITLSRFKEARVALNRALKYSPQENKWCVYFEMGDLYKEKGDIKRAIGWYKKGIEENKQSASGYIYIGLCLWQLEKFDESEVWFKNAIKCKEGAIEEAYYNLAGYYRIKENLNQAKKFYLDALQIDPNYDEAKLGLKEVTDAIKFET